MCAFAHKCPPCVPCVGLGTSGQQQPVPELPTAEMGGEAPAGGVFDAVGLVGLEVVNVFAKVGAGGGRFWGANSGADGPDSAYNEAVGNTAGDWEISIRGIWPIRDPENYRRNLT